MATYEQPAREIAQRLLSSRAGTPWESLHSSPNMLRDVSNEVSGWPIQIDDSGHDIGKLVATIRLAARKGTKVVIVDYLQLVPPEDASVMREQQVASSSRKLKQVAMACNVCVIVLSQLNRQVENRPDARPRLSDLVNRERWNKTPIRRGCSGGRTRDRPTNLTPWPASTSPKTATARPASSTSTGTARPARSETRSRTTEPTTSFALGQQERREIHTRHQCRPRFEDGNPAPQVPAQDAAPLTRISMR